ncbi:cAMP-binding domain of CRP or a regulatory subunit of cAMP-dependent protein kinases [Rhizobium sp. NFR07]|uniref:Crp/Fnr family transcriptional regulator n=1 Tax=Rhizobium sp. NFR07 TaxID=1566262 RepID=UPI0008EE077D|nr:Crp/Fnr family transcriptional regulator [Rhizobium sp. NFR07]SFB64643.1 cAMP-binding domain of CRP or a regulatory subunit of cAMP-dependent protein kinases [Rhizobium sp. NFR07]
MSWTANKILSRLSSEDRAIVAPHLESVELKQRQILFRANEKVEYVYFFESGLSSEIAGKKGAEIEVGCVGREGFSAVPVALGMDSTPHHAFMQQGGIAMRIGAAELREASNRSSSLRTLLLSYAHVFMIQVASTALADARYQVDQRLARWLLMCQDRIGDELPLTHDFLALMLGVRRPSVTEALHRLEGGYAIRADRVLITIRNRSVLEEVAGDCYGVPEAEYRRLIGD